MRILAIESIDRRGSLATLTVRQDCCELVQEVSLPKNERTACSLVPQISSLLKKCSWDIENVDLLCVATGPGSFTGLRIGVITAKTLAYSSAAKLVGVHSLSALAMKIADSGEHKKSQRVWAILDAQRQELFAASYTFLSESEMVTPPDTLLLKIDEWLDLLQPGDLVTGPPLNTLADRIPSGVTIAESELWSPTARAIGKLGAKIFLSQGGIDPMQLVPNYFRKSAAEEKADAIA